MCTVTFMPTAKNEFILTSNRDENASRSPQNISQMEENGQTLIFPRDTTAGGTWIAASSQNRLVCLLNGAFDRHPRKPPYRKSRGIMVLEYFQSTDANQFFAAYDLSGMESFTMITYEQGQLWDFRWEETSGQKYIKSLDTTQYHIWSSATLYEKPIQRKREKWLDEWLVGRTDFSSSAILELHKRGGEGNPSIDFMMHRYNHLVETVSITQVAGKNGQLQMTYHDLIREVVKEKAVTIVPKKRKG
ncbi:MAG: NRDE family protein [Bacteroidota bacterium]